MVTPGIEVLLRDKLELIRDCRIGLLSHAPSVDRLLRNTAECLENLGLVRILAPEHGFFGAAQDMEPVDHEGELKQGVEVLSLYGDTPESLKPDPAMLEDLDVLVIDVVDVGARYYTYIWTAALCIEAAAAAGLRVVLCDRPNPLGGITVQGPLLREDHRSFVGLHPLPVRHGMTVGEIVGYLNGERGLVGDIEVVRCEGWSREDTFDRTGLPWVLPSPNMPTLDTALVYPGGGLLEGTELSEGRGTTKPFELLGAPWIDGKRVVEHAGKALTEAGLAEGCAIRPWRFKPMFHKHAGQVCGGVQVHVLDGERFAPFETYLALVMAIRRLWPDEFAWREKPYEFVTDRPAFDLLCGGPEIREAIEEGAGLPEVAALWRDYLAGFRDVRERYLLYRD